MEKSSSFKYYTQQSDFGFNTTDRRLAFSRQASFKESTKPFLSRTSSSIDIPPGFSYFNDKSFGEPDKFSIFRALKSMNRPMKRLFILISLNVAYSTVEMAIGLFTGRAGLVSDAFHLTFGCGLLTFSMFAMAASRQKPDIVYTYGYKRLEVLSAFTNALWKHFMRLCRMNPSTITNLLVNLIGVWFFRNYARINIVYRKAEDMNYHSVCLHVLADSIRSAGLILASWFLSLGVQNAEVLCLGLVSVAVFMLVMPLFKTTGGILLQMAPPSIPASALSKCCRQVTSREDVFEVSQARFWALVPGHVVGSISLQVKEGTDDHSILQFVHGLYHDLGIQDLTVQTDY
ncbi:metal tolerance protein C2-like isoform X3 [Mangifera indica]|uniref:metal tolerance protein C2-like isoform X3 n=1 Tax=Mangifera indica TaxID=29780 RepID=UPI001CFB82CA|nr:metal tolerance protein C2-like isoform X3 [Mangifera indica]